MSSFFQKRLARHQKKMMKYMRYVLNDHFVLVCLFLIGGVGLYYSNWLKTLQPPFAIGGLIISVFWMLCLFVGKMATFAEAADIVFLLPKEKEMQTYLERAFRYSCIFPLIFLILACGLAMPLVVVSTEQSFSMFFVYLIILWSLKFSHLQIKRAELFRLDQQVIRYWKLGWFFSFSDLFVSIILLANMGRNSRCISTGKSILLVFVEATRKRIGLGENGACRRT